MSKSPFSITGLPSVNLFGHGSAAFNAGSQHGCRATAMPRINTYILAQNSANVCTSSKNSHYQTASIEVKTVAAGLFAHRLAQVEIQAKPRLRGAQIDTASTGRERIIFYTG